MAAVLWPRSGDLELDADGVPIPGAMAYFYDSETTTPRTVYQEGDLATPHTVPVETDGDGRWPAVYMQTGAYKVRVLDSAAALIYEQDKVAPSEEISTDPAVIDEDRLLATGEIFTRYGTSTTRSGAVPLSGGTIGSAASGASVRANDDCEDLFTWLWNQDSGVNNLTVSTGKGASAAADWAANKTITLPDVGHHAAFSASKNAVAQSAPSNTDTKVTFTTEVFDTGSYYDAANSKWTPPIGIYTVTLRLRYDTTNAVDGEFTDAQIRVNGSAVAVNALRRYGLQRTVVQVTAILSLNGTDYVEAYGKKDGAGNGQFDGTVTDSHFYGASLSIPASAVPSVTFIKL